MPREDEDDIDDRPPPRRARRREDDDDDDDDRPRRRRRRDDDDDEYEARRTGSDATGGLIPYKNGKALAAYYCGVFGLIPCLGTVIAVIAIVFGFLGLSHAKKFPESRGQAHAITGIVLGFVSLIGHVVAVVVFSLMARR